MRECVNQFCSLLLEMGGPDALEAWSLLSEDLVDDVTRNDLLMRIGRCALYDADELANVDEPGLLLKSLKRTRGELSPAAEVC